MPGIDTLKQIRFLNALSDQFLEEIVTIAELNHFGEEEILFEQGEHQSLIYMLVEGKIFLNCKSVGGKLITLDEVLAGQTFGVSALLDDFTTTFTAICAEPSKVITISAHHMQRLFERDYALGHQVMEQVVNNFKKRMNKHTRQFMHSLEHHPAMS